MDHPKTPFFVWSTGLPGIYIEIYIYMFIYIYINLPPLSKVDDTIPSWLVYYSSLSTTASASLVRTGSVIGSDRGKEKGSQSW